MIIREHRAEARAAQGRDGAMLGGLCCLVAGVGVVGSAIAETLARLGVGHIIVADFDLLEARNLGRSAGYGFADVGQPKAQVLQRHLDRISIAQEPLTTSFTGSVSQLGLGVFDRADVVFSATDNVEARLLVNEKAMLMGTPVVMGGMQAQDPFQAAVSITDTTRPEAPCYRCFRRESAIELRDAARRNSCLDVGRQEVAAGGAPSSPIAGQIVGVLMAHMGLQALREREAPASVGRALKLDLDAIALTPVLWGKANPRCKAAHSPEEKVFEPLRLADLSHQSTLGQLVERLQGMLEGEVKICMPHEIVESHRCLGCGAVSGLRPFANIHAFARATKAGDVVCSQCQSPEGQIRDRSFEAIGSWREPFQKYQDRTLAELGFCAFDIVKVCGYAPESVELWVELSGDQPFFTRPGSICQFGAGGPVVCTHGEASP